jgi:hypothetical protein
MLQELLDILFWMRKYKNIKGALGLMEDKVNEIIEKALDAAKKGSFEFKDLAVIFFDVSHLGKSCDNIAG